MILEQGLSAVTQRTESIVTVGTFDGIHLGHRKIVSDLIQRAQSENGLSTLITFDPHPREVLLQQPMLKLTTIQERASILDSLGLGRMVVIPFTKKFSHLSAEEFVTDILVRHIGLQTIVVGEDHRFGRDRKGDVDLLVSLGRLYQFDIDVIPQHVVDDVVVSSRKIRSLLQKDGNVASAQNLLNYPYSFTATVIPGDGRGRGMGYPTANLSLDDGSKIIPAHGIYVVRVEGLSDMKGGMLSIGVRPTIEGSQGVHIEVHLFDFSRSIYGQKVTVHFVDRIRGEKKFDSLQELQEAMGHDEIISRKILEQHPLSHVKSDNSS